MNTCVHTHHIFRPAEAADFIFSLPPTLLNTLSYPPPQYIPVNSETIFEHQKIPRVLSLSLLVRHLVSFRARRACRRRWPTTSCTSGTCRRRWTRIRCGTCCGTSPGLRPPRCWSSGAGTPSSSARIRPRPRRPSSRSTVSDASSLTGRLQTGWVWFTNGVLESIIIFKIYAFDDTLGDKKGILWQNFRLINLYYFT